MLQGKNKQAVILSHVPLIQNGLENVIHQYFSNIDIIFCHKLNTALHEKQESVVSKPTYWNKTQSSRTLSTLSPTERLILRYLT